MEALGQKPEHALDGVPVGPGGDLQDLIMVETSGIGHAPAR